MTPFRRPFMAVPSVAAKVLLTVVLLAAIIVGFRNQRLPALHPDDSEDEGH